MKNGFWLEMDLSYQCFRRLRPQFSSGTIERPVDRHVPVDRLVDRSTWKLRVQFSVYVFEYRIVLRRGPVESPFDRPVGRSKARSTAQRQGLCPEKFSSLDWCRVCTGRKPFRPGCGPVDRPTCFPGFRVLTCVLIPVSRVCFYVFMFLRWHAMIGC